MGKKVGLATCFLDNYGACLQAYALQEKIVQLGHDCSIIPYVEPDGYEKEVSFAKLRWIKARLQKNDALARHYKRAALFSRFKKEKLRFEKEKGKVVYYQSYQQLKDAPPKYDAYVCGSDQVWNPLFYNKNNPAYFLQFAQDKKKVAYAPSIGLSALPEQYQEEFKQYVSTFDALSTREDAGTKIVQEVGGRDCLTVLDPTLLVGGEFWKDKVKKPSGFPYKQYVFCYLFSNTEKVAAYVKEMQAVTGLPVVYLPVSDLVYDVDGRLVDAGPLEFLWLIQNATFVLTDSFHCSAFSIMFHKDFSVIDRQRRGEDVNMSSRIVNLMRMAGIENGFADVAKPYEKSAKIDYAAVDNNMQKYRDESEAYLRKALED